MSIIPWPDQIRQCNGASDISFHFLGALQHVFGWHAEGAQKIFVSKLNSTKKTTQMTKPLNSTADLYILRSTREYSKKENRNKQRRLFIRRKERDQETEIILGKTNKQTNKTLKKHTKQLNAKVISWHCRCWSVAKYWNLHFSSLVATITSVHLVSYKYFLILILNLNQIL